MTALNEVAKRLLDQVKAERALPQADRSTLAGDVALDLVASLLVTAAQARTDTERALVRGRISRLVVDAWSLDAPLAEDLVSFDHRFLVP